MNEIHRTGVVVLFACACLTGPCAALAEAAPKMPAAAPKTSIVFILTDDLDVSVWDQALQRGALPHIKADLVDMGTTFAESFVSLSVCCPSRVTLLTGQYPHNHGVVRNTGPHGGFEAFVQDDLTIARWMHDAGYRTGLIGKYLNEYGGPRGTYVPPGWDRWRGLMSVTEYNYSISHDGVVVHYGEQPEDYQTDVIAGMAEDFIRAADQRPFFLLVTPTAPHFEGTDDDGGKRLRPAPRHEGTPRLSRIPPEKLRSFNEAEMGDKPAWMRDEPLVDVVMQRDGYNDKIAAMRAVDDLVGRVVAALADTGRLDRTVILFGSDNGYQYGTHRRTAKTDLYEESARVPLVVRGPGQRVPRQSREWIVNIDWAPTILDYAAVAAGGSIDGQSFRPYVEQPDLPARRRSMLFELPGDGTRYEQHPSLAMLRTKDPALTLDATGSKVVVYAETYASDGAVTDLEIYDLQADPLQLRSAPERATARQKALLADRLAALRACRAAECARLER